MPVNTLRVLVLVDGFDTEELFQSLGRLLPLRDAELLLVYVHGPGPRAALNLASRRPGGHRLPAERERGLADAELERDAGALEEAEKLAHRLGASAQTRQVEGEPGHVVCGLARTERMDLVALRGTGRGRPPAGPASLGPTARFVVDHSPCPVLLLRSAG